MHYKLKFKSKTTKLPEEKFFVILVGQCVLNYNTKIIFKNGKLDFIKTKTFAL